MNKIYVIGGSNVDIFAKSKNELIIKDSNPSSINFAYGGVARNIAYNLNNLGLKVNFISAFSNDIFGKEMHSDLRNRGINLDYSIISDKYPSSIYLAILNKEDMYLGASDMSITELLNIDYFKGIKDLIDEKDYLYFDTNLKEETIDYICNNLKGYKIVDAISASKAIKLKKHLAKIDLLKLNKMEAEKLLDEELSTDEEIEKAAKKLVNKGLNEVIITSRDSIYKRSLKAFSHYKHFNYIENPVNVTGAGDALLATYIYTKLKRMEEIEAIKFCLAAAILTINVKEAVAELNVDKVKEKAKEIKVLKI